MSYRELARIVETPLDRAVDRAIASENQRELEHIAALRRPEYRESQYASGHANGRAIISELQRSHTGIRLETRLVHTLSYARLRAREGDTGASLSSRAYWLGLARELREVGA